MKIIIIGTLLLISGLSCRGDKQTAEEKKQVRQGSMVPNTFDSISQYHCNILDSAAKNPPKDTMYHCCYNSVNFMRPLLESQRMSKVITQAQPGLKKQICKNGINGMIVLSLCDKDHHIPGLPRRCWKN